MATCANCIHHSLCDYNTNISGNGKVRLVYADGADRKCSFFQNTADVVPKSEVEKIVDVAQKNIDSANERAERLRVESEKLRVFYENARHEVAREIFEEIEKALEKNKFQGLSCLLNEFAELKKKYTEDKT